ncbi:hypothetical protein SBOR_2276 [Sclerotinia borealis F-4128]|uniref:Uncharacterized protein n=1 Tax=Sclerotinia borealis (strain F-4128) TaxID=1432307 RepID=W9CNE3_SCLBF|nr:hypothetical protein SBOR_2276 [Sclerotinia borealis F-4128]
MSSKEKEKHGRSEPVRRNTLQRMLDLEKRTKLQRMQASTPVSQPLRNSFFRERRPSNPNVYTIPAPENPIPSRQTTRAMTIPTLSVAIPPTQTPEKPKAKPKIFKNVVVVEPTKKKSEVGAHADDSDASSICRSPAWDGGEGKQKRMAKREAQDLRKKEEERLRKEKEKVEKETRAAVQKQKGRLSKAPPTNKRPSKTIPAIPMSRANTEPSVQVTPEITQPSPDPDDGRRSRRTSLDLGLKKLMSSFRSRSSSASATPRTQSIPSSPTLSGFMGGLKLQQSNENPVQDESRDGKSSNNRTVGNSNKPSQSRPPISLENSRYRTLDLLSSSGSSAPAVELPTNSQSEDSNSLHTLPQPEASQKSSSDQEPIMSRNVRARKPSEDIKSHHITESTVNTKAKPSPHAIASSPGFRFGLEDTQSYNEKKQEPLYFKNFDTSPESINPENNDYFPKQKRHGKERDLRSSSHEIKLDAAPKKEIMRRTPSIHNGHSRVKSAHGSIGNSPQINMEISENGEDFRTFLDGEYAPPSFRLTAQSSHSSIQAEEGMFSRRDLQMPSYSPSPLSPTFKGINDATSNLYPKPLYLTNSPSLQTSSLDEPLKKLRPKSALSPRTNGFDSRSALPSQSGRRISEPEYLSPTTLSSPKIKATPKEKLPPQMGNATSTPRRQKKDRRSSSRSFTGSSEEYLSFDEQSTITTPAASRPQSHKGPVVTGHDTASRQNHKVQDPWNQTPLPIRLKDEDGNTIPSSGQGAPTAQSRKLHSSLASADPNTEAGVADLQRRLSLSKSSSTTALQNSLNFLPELKHQPLRPRQGQSKRQTSEGNNVSGNGNGNLEKGRRESTSASAYAQYNNSKNSIMSSPVPNGGESSNSNGNSSSSEKDLNTGSSQYLRSARLAIPPKNGLRSSAHQHSAATSAQSLHSNGQGGMEPMAKMFVICCGCNYFHDLPSKLYECMAKPEAVVKDEGLGVSGVVSTRVSCPWCGHGMSTRCCQGWAAVVVLKERMH